MENKEETKRVFLHIIALPVFVFLAPALKLLVNNSAYFNISIVEAIAAVLSISVLMVVPLFVLALFKPLRTALRLFVVFMVISSVIATFLLPVSLGVIEGGASTTLEPRKEAFLFLLFAMAAFLFSLVTIKFLPESGKKIIRSIDALKWMAIVYVAVFAIYALISTPSTFSFPATGSFTPRNDSVSAHVSTEKNIFIISFDQLQGSFMEGFLQNHPGKKSVFEGFVLYPDAAATYPNTTYSISSMLRGRIANNKEETGGYAINASDSILAIARENGFAVYNKKNVRNKNYHCINCPGDEAAFNFIKAYELVRHSVNLAFGADIQALGIGLPRNVTGIADTDLIDHFWQIDLHEFESITNALTTDSSKPTIYFMHFLGTHQPFVYNHDCTLKTPDEIAKSQNIDGATAEMSCSTMLLDSFFTRLKDLSIYDESMIFVISDHGYEININKLYHEENGDRYFHRTGAVVAGDENIKPVGSYNPVLLFKDFNSREKMAIDPSPASLIDIAPTICESLGCDQQWEGFSLRNKIPANRERKFWQYFGGSERRDADGTDRFHDSLNEWWKVNRFNGPVYPNLAFAMGLTEKEYYSHYTIGQRFDFDANGNSRIYKTHGWAGQEQNYCWTKGPQAGLRFNLRGESRGEKPQDLLLRLKAFAYLGGGLPHQNVNVTVNGRNIATWRVSDDGWYEAGIPVHEVMEDDRLLEVVFGISDPTAPRDVSGSSDSRKLGIAVQAVQIVEKDRE